jgi:hypothetical protein
LFDSFERKKKGDIISFISQMMHKIKKIYERGDERNHLVSIKMTVLMRRIMRNCRQYTTLAADKINNKNR